MSITIKEVATEAGVSVSTVSQVLSGNGTVHISLKTQEKVRRIALDLEYTPNRFAKSLSEGYANTIGLILPDLKNPFFVHLLDRMESRIIAAGYKVMLDADYEHQRQENTKGKLRGWPVDGVIMWALRDESAADAMGAQATKTPTVYLTGQDRALRHDTISIDFYTGAQYLVRHLASRGYRRISYVLPYLTMIDDLTFEPRYLAYKQTMDELGFPVDTIETHPVGETLEAGWRTGQRIAALAPSQRPEVLFCHNDVIAIGAYHGLKRGGLSVPEEIAVVGHDGIEAGLYLDKPLTTMTLPLDEICHHTVEMMFKKLKGGDEPQPEMKISPRFTVGETTR